MQGAKDYNRRVFSQQTHKYDALGNYQAGSPLYSPYSEVLGIARSSPVSTNQLRHSSSLPSSRQSSSSLSIYKPAALTRSQLAEEKHIRRQNSILEARGGSQGRPMSAERSRPGSAASQLSKHDSMSWESTSGAIKWLSGGQSDAKADMSKYDGNGYPRSTGRSSSRPASPAPSTNTIPAYNSLPRRASYTIPFQPPSRHSLGATGSSSTDPAHLSASIPSALLRRSSIGASTVGRNYAAEASECWGPQHQVKEMSTPSAQDSGPQDFLSLLEKSKGSQGVGASHGVPKRTNSNPQELFERSGQLMYSLGDKFRSMTQRSPPRRTVSSSASAAEKCRPSHAGQAGMTTEAAGKAAQYASSHQREHAASDSSRDPGHLFSLEKLNRHNGRCDSMSKQRDGMRADATPSSGFRARAYEASRDDGEYGQSSKSASALTGSKYGPQTNPTVGLGNSRHGAASANAQSSRSSGSYIGSRSIDEQARTNTLPRQGIKSIALLQDSWGLSGFQSDSLPASKLVHTSSGSRDTESKHDQGSETTARTARHDAQQAVHTTSKHDMLHAWRATGDEATSLPDPPGVAAAEEAADAAARPAAMQASGADSPAGAASHRAASSLSQMHQSMRKSSALAKGVSSQQLSAAISASGGASASGQYQGLFGQSGEGAIIGKQAAQAGLSQSAQPSTAPVPIQPSILKSDHMAADSSHMMGVSLTASSQLPSTAASTARQLAAELAASVTLCHASADHSPSASVQAEQGSASELQGTQLQGYPHLQQPRAWLPHTSSPAVATEADDIDSALGTDGGQSERPAVVYSPSPQLSCSTPELREAIELSLSHDTLPHQQSHHELQHCDAGHDAEQPQPSVSASPSRQLSASSPELNEAIRMSLSSEFLPEAEPEAASPSASQTELICSLSQHAEPHSEPDMPLTQLPAASPTASLTASPAASPSASVAPSAMESFSTTEHPTYASGAPSSDLRPTQISASNPSSSASDAEPMHRQERQSHALGQPIAAPTPAPEDHTSSSPSKGESEARAALSSAPVQVRTDVQQASNIPATAQDSSPGQSQPDTTHKGPSQGSPAPNASLPSTSGRTTPAPILTSSSPKPPNLSPGTAAQIDGDAALARQLQKLELSNESAAAESSAAMPAAEADDADVDLAALQDVEVPLVGDQLPLAALVEDYEGSPRVCGNLVPLMQRFPYFRRIRGDGNCFYRAFMMAFVEDICLDPNTARCRILLAVFEQLYTRVKRWEEGIDDNYYFFVRKGYHIVKEMIFKIHNRQLDLEDVMGYMCSSRVDSYLVHLLRAITANELWRKQDHYKTFIPGIDAYGGLEMADIIVQAVLPMGTEVEHLQVEALVATLPMCLKILDVAGSTASIYTFEPASVQSQALAPAAQKLWLIYRPGHYEVVYPEAASENLEKL